MFQIIFTVSYVGKREQLEELNFLIRNSDHVQSDDLATDVSAPHSENHQPFTLVFLNRALSTFHIRTSSIPV